MTDEDREELARLAGEEFEKNNRFCSLGFMNANGTPEEQEERSKLYELARAEACEASKNLRLMQEGLGIQPPAPYPVQDQMGVFNPFRVVWAL